MEMKNDLSSLSSSIGSEKNIPTKQKTPEQQKEEEIITK